MGSRSIIAFHDAGDNAGDYDVFVYQHWTSSPKDIGSQLEGALAYAWPLPRYEHDDMAAAFVRHVKREMGGVRIVSREFAYSIAGCDFVYLVTHYSNNEHLTVTTSIFKGHTEFDEEIWEPWRTCSHNEMWKLTDALTSVA